MSTIERSDWQDADRFVSDPDLVTAILRNAQFSVTRMEQFFVALQDRRQIELPNILRLTRSFPGFMQGDAHLALRRTVAPFFSASAAQRWAGRADAAIDRAIGQLRGSATPDLMRDFCQPLYVDCFRHIIGCDNVTTERLVGLVSLANELSHPMLPLKELAQIDAALGGLRASIRVRPGTAPDALAGFLACQLQQSQPDMDPADLAVSVMAAGYAVAQTLGSILYHLLLRDQAVWHKAAAPGWSDQEVEGLIARHASTRTLVRVAAASGEAKVLDISRANARIDPSDAAAGRHLSFGSGPHKCPGAPLARLLIGRAIPALAGAFPDLCLKRDETRFKINDMVQFPVRLPCALGKLSARQTNRMVSIRNMADARKLVNNDKTWAPPQLEPHLHALAQRSGRDLQTALRIARNAMFFMSGPRHAAIRRAVAEQLGGNRLVRWQAFMDAQIGSCLDRLATQPQPDLIAHFSEPLFRRVTQPILGVDVTDQARFDSLAPVLQDVLEPWLPLRELERLQASFAELLNLMRLPAVSDAPDSSLLVHLMKCDLPDCDTADLKALVLVLYGASFNLSHTLGNVLHALALEPAETRKCAADPDWVRDRLESLIAAGASPKYIYRMAREPARVGGIEIATGDTARLELLTINRGQRAGHLAFGHGLHHCVGAALTKRLLRAAIPAFFARFPEVSLVPQGHRYHDLSQTVALAHLPCRLTAPNQKDPACPTPRSMQPSCPSSPRKSPA